MKTLTIMDPIAGVNIHHDSSFATMLRGQERGYQNFYCEMQDLFVLDGEPVCSAFAITVQQKEGAFYRLGERIECPLNEFDVVFMRKDPPVDRGYLYTTYLLELVDPGQVLVVNNPSALRSFNEKLATLRFPDLVPPSFVGRDLKRLRDFIGGLGTRVVVKPLHGFGGMGIFVSSSADPNLGVILETATRNGAEFILVQKFITEVAQTGDKRIMVIDGEPTGAMARIPQGVDHRANMAAGGIPVKCEITDRDRVILERLKPFLRQNGILMAGLDIIGGYLTEINITSPTGGLEIDAFHGTDTIGAYLDAVEKRLN